MGSEFSSSACPDCGDIVGAQALYCAACGTSLDGGPKAVDAVAVFRARDEWPQVRLAALFYVFLLGELILFQNLAGHDATLEPYLVADLTTLGAVLLFGWSIRRQVVGLFRLPTMDTVSWSLLAIGTTLAWLVNQGILWMSTGLPTAVDVDIFADLAAAGASAPTIFVLTCVTPPLLEEVAFRGILLERIREPFGDWSAVLVVSVLFSILHLAILSFLPFAGLAIVFGALRIRTGSLWPPFAGHALFNIASWQMWSQ